MLCIPFSEEQLEELKKYAALNEMEVEDFIKNVCLTHCLQQMEYIHGQSSEAFTCGGGAAKSEKEPKFEPEIEPRKIEKADVKKIEVKNKPTSKDLLDGPLVLDQQCIMDLFNIKRQFCDTSNNKIITIALKLGLSQLSVSIDLLKHKLEEK